MGWDNPHHIVILKKLKRPAQITMGWDNPHHIVILKK